MTAPFVKSLFFLSALGVFGWGVYVLRNPDWYVALELRNIEKLSRIRLLGAPTRFLLGYPNAYEPKSLRRKAFVMGCGAILWSICVIVACLLPRVAP